MYETHIEEKDTVEATLRAYAQNILVIVFGLLPILFLPILEAPLEYTKAFLAVICVFIVLILFSLSVLRSGTLSIGVSYPLLAFWALVGITFISSVLSGDFKDSLIGDFFSTHATVFVAILALISTTLVLIKPNKTTIMKMYILLGVSTLLLVVFHVLRIVFSSSFLSFGVFTNSVFSPVGTWNDLALFLGLMVILSLVALEQLTLTRIGRALFVVVTIASLFILGVINFFTVWIILGLTSLAIIVYTLGRDRFSGSQISLLHSKVMGERSFKTTLLVFVISVAFIIGGATIGGFIAKYTNISYVEVRPSFEATANITRSVYQENAFLGIGANKFSDAWRLYKDNSINATVFWNTDFSAGNGYITTFFATTGVLGGVAWVVFLITYLVLGIRRLTGATSSDKTWYFIGVSSFVGGVYVWVMSLIYVPGVVILLLGAVCTGVSLHAFDVLGGIKRRAISVGGNRGAGFALTLVVTTVIIGSVSILYVAGRHYTSIYTFNKSVIAMGKGEDIDALEREVVNAYQLSSSDVFARRIAEYQLTRMRALVAVPEPTDEQRKEFQDAQLTGLNAAQEAIRIDGLESTNWSVLAGLYGTLASVGVEGARDRALEALVKARELNPTNPIPYLDSAIVEGQAGNFDAARGYIREAINLKPNFTEALYFLSQLEIATGDVEAAVASTQAVIQLEPQNAARYYQLGVLERARNNLEGAMLSFEKAISLDQNYANARYLLALVYDELGRSTEAKQQLEVVLSLNPGNVDVTTLIQVIESEGSLTRLRGGAQGFVSEATPSVDSSGSVSTNQESDTPLVEPINTVPKAEDNSIEGTE